MSNNKQTAVEWLEKICNDRGYFLMSEYFEKAKEMEKEQSHLYSAFCFKCINEKIPVIKFEDWINL
jgi:hypothetical protein